MSAKFYLDLGNQYPYDAPDSWWEGMGGSVFPAPEDWAHRAARGILSNLNDRRNIKRGFENIDEDVRKEIVQFIAEVIRLAYGE